MRFILRKGITAIEETKKMAVLRCCGFLKPGGFTASSAAVKQTCCQKFPTLRKEERVSLPGRGPAGFVPRGAKPRELPPAPRCPRPAGTLGGGLAELPPGGQVSCSGPARGSGDRPSPAERGGSACAQSPTEEADATFLGVLWLAREGRCRLFPPSASSAHRFSPGAPEGVGRGPALHSPGHTGTVRGAGAAPPERQPEG